MRLLVLLVTSLVCISTPSALARCIPSDPDSSNPGNLCPEYPPGGIRPSGFLTGNGVEGYFGLSPTMSSYITPLQRQSLGPDQIISAPRNGSFWSLQNSTDQGVRVRSNDGREYQYSPK